MDDLDLVRRVLDGDPNAYRILVVRYQRPIFRFVRTFGLPEAVVEELAQEVFLRAYRSLASFDPGRGAAFSTWLFTIAKNATANETAKISTKYAMTDRRAGNDAPVDDARAVSAAGNQHEALETAERHALLHRALGALPQVFRTAVALAYLKELSLDEIASIERCSVGTIKSRIFRGKRLLAVALSRTEG